MVTPSCSSCFPFELFLQILSYINSVSLSWPMLRVFFWLTYSSQSCSFLKNYKMDIVDTALPAPPPSVFWWGWYWWYWIGRIGSSDNHVTYLNNTITITRHWPVDPSQVTSFINLPDYMFIGHVGRDKVTWLWCSLANIRGSTWAIREFDGLCFTGEIAKVI